MKKFIVIISVMLMLLTLVSCGKKGSDEAKHPTTYKGTEAFEYEECDGGVCIINFKNPDGIEYKKIYVPSAIDGKPVVGIGHKGEAHINIGAVYGECEVVIPDSVTYIGDSAFAGARGMVKLSGGDNCEYIGDYAFMRCDHLKEVTFIDDCEHVADTAFAGCDAYGVAD